MFHGRFEHNLDDKGRLALPVAFRKKLGADEASETSVMVTISDRCLAAYPMDEWEKKVALLNQQSQIDPKITALKRIFVGLAQECQIDKAGRILIPSDLRRDVRIERECVVLGQIDKFEIWSGAQWQQNFSQLSDSIGAIYASLAEQGIQL